MFGLKYRIEASDLKVQLEDLKKENKDLKYANAAYQNKHEQDMQNASYAIDWDAMKAFSVERIWDNGLPKTIIGYMLQEPAVHTEGEGGEPRVTFKDIVREWTLHCSAEKHEELVKEFAEWKGKGKKK